MKRLFNCFFSLFSVNKKTNNLYFTELNRATWENTKPYVPAVEYGKVIKVYDGDTITIAAKLHEDYPVNRFSVRLNGIDAPELKSKNENEKNHAVISRDALKEKILGRIVRLENVKTEKYGRLLADVYLHDMNICEWLLLENYAVAYDGGTKSKPKEWDE